ncbi:reverse transcriptase N-terminal domain-containing protein [Lamprobacter sp.]|uniref:reverse transcriptase N-terminal domain-containing protein n=1 Tax=Lamprobacter sp. TaxID=3100796 RepID=UPI003A4E16A6
MLAGAVSDRCPWHSITWHKAYKTVKRLQARIVEAVKAGDWSKVHSLQFILSRSHAAKVVAIKVIFAKGFTRKQVG